MMVLQISVMFHEALLYHVVASTLKLYLITSGISLVSVLKKHESCYILCMDSEQVDLVSDINIQ